MTTYRHLSQCLNSATHKCASLWLAFKFFLVRPVNHNCQVSSGMTYIICIYLFWSRTLCSWQAFVYLLSTCSRSFAHVYIISSMPSDKEASMFMKRTPAALQHLLFYSAYASQLWSQGQTDCSVCSQCRACSPLEQGIPLRSGLTHQAWMEQCLLLHKCEWVGRTQQCTV